MQTNNLKPTPKPNTKPKKTLLLIGTLVLLIATIIFGGAMYTNYRQNKQQNKKISFLDKFVLKSSVFFTDFSKINDKLKSSEKKLNNLFFGFDQKRKEIIENIAKQTKTIQDFEAGKKALSDQATNLKAKFKILKESLDYIDEKLQKEIDFNKALITAYTESHEKKYKSLLSAVFRNDDVIISTVNELSKAVRALKKRDKEIDQVLGANANFANGLEKQIKILLNDKTKDKPTTQRSISTKPQDLTN